MVRRNCRICTATSRMNLLVMALPNGRPVIPLSASRFAGMAAAIVESYYFFHIISENEPDFFIKGHIYMKIGQKLVYTRLVIPMVVIVHMHSSSPHQAYKQQDFIDLLPISCLYFCKYKSTFYYSRFLPVV